MICGRGGGTGAATARGALRPELVDAGLTSAGSLRLRSHSLSSNSMSGFPGSGSCVLYTASYFRRFLADDRESVESLSGEAVRGFGENRQEDLPEASDLASIRCRTTATIRPTTIRAGRRMAAIMPIVVHAVRWAYSTWPVCSC